ncbi:hypothetical protein QQ045_005513 [Rhodiola kirilowii]
MKNCMRLKHNAGIECGMKACRLCDKDPSPTSVLNSDENEQCIARCIVVKCTTINKDGNNSNVENCVHGCLGGCRR